MPGAFAHITAVNIASANNALMTLDMPREAKKALAQNKRYLELGCVSPDYPYLDLMDSAQNKWADEMHYNNVGKLIDALVQQVKSVNSEHQEKAFAWLCGFGAHVAADITIHPVVEMKVGPYAENAKTHRVCEMNQDAYIWSSRLNLGDIGMADRVKENIGSCVDVNDDNSIDPIINDIWHTALNAIYPDYANECQPNINAWHKGFQTVVDNAEESHRLFPWARHVASKQGLTYPLHEEVDTTFIESLETPDGTKHYDEVFDKAIETIQLFWEQTAAAVFEDSETDFFKNWNLDTGRCENGLLTAWGNQ
ncbi:zinc dependent phospholipase C family protein [Enterovibrio sp. ZSDZ42]|uniref:Zinc dependent phospholipase C family protein n=1 Tax=Enterovibrio gelatinilyticus TaxID=2899819 RepID=A0ABT5R226_9GAMM|nr:zinc dependent phospholipase C family protein [Enterovibrio sp. ZSDZ42]MDD1794329.1 zinc dependent phospholipase C family protein [Enterovibrio sp. ZSDZ42]